MNYAVYTFSGEGLAIANKLKKEGNSVVVGFIGDEKDTLLESEKKHAKPENPKKKERRLNLYKGILKRFSAKQLTNFLRGIPLSQRKDWFIFNDFNQNFKFADQLQDLGFHGNFPTATDRKFEKDRGFAKEFVRQHYPDIKVAEEQEFKTIKEGIKFLQDTKDLWVLKGNDDMAKTFVADAEDPEVAKQQVISALTEGKKNYEKLGFILEKRIVDAIEVTPEIQFYNGEPILATVDIENKQIGAGNQSFMTGCAQDLSFPLNLKSKLAEITFPPVVYGLAKMRKGWFIWDLSILFDKKDGTPYMGEFCPNRPGYNCIFSELALVNSATEYFESLVKSKNPYDKTVGKFATSVRLFDFDRDHKTLMAKENKKISFTEETANDLWLWDVKKEGDELVTAGYASDDRYLDIAVITGFGDSIKQAAERMYMYVDGFSYEDIYYRPLFDFVSQEYPSSITNRYDFLVKNKLL